jgi:ornithine cyclodeaminase
MEGSIISAKRTAASAALAARCLRHNRPTSTVAMIGCGLINFEVARFLLAVFPEVRNLAVYDTRESQSHYFKHKCEEAFDGLKVDVVPDVKTALSSAPLISMATTAVKPHITDLSDCAAGSTILHVSLRDISPEAILGCDNIVDDVDHVCRAQTSVHLAEQLTGTRDFIRCSLSDILLERDAPVKDEESIAVFSPFGLGVLDVAVAKLVYELGCEKNMGTEIEQFLPSSWAETKAAGVV